jgi:hypothetical protein
MTEDMPKGWVKPVAEPTRESLMARVAELRAELAEAENQLREIEEGARLEALVKVRNLMRAFELTPADRGLTAAPTQGRCGTGAAAPACHIERAGRGGTASQGCWPWRAVSHGMHRAPLCSAGNATSQLGLDTAGGTSGPYVKWAGEGAGENRWANLGQTNGACMRRYVKLAIELPNYLKQKILSAS